MATAVAHSATGTLQGSRDRDAAWFDEEVPELDPKTRELLEDYAKIPHDDVERRLKEYRDRTWVVFPYPCVGQFRFVELNAHRQKSYSSILVRLQQGQRLLDVGCCYAQELRRMVLDGAPSANMYGVDLQRGFVDLAYDFFGDRDTLQTRFLAGDVTRPDDGETGAELAALRGTVDMLHVGMVLHLWDLETQTRFCEALVQQYARPEPGTLVFGHSAGRVEAAEWPNPLGKVMFKQNPDSFAAMWDEVSRRTGTRWKVDAWLYHGSMEKNHWDDPQARKLMFEVTRL